MGESGMTAGERLDDLEEFEAKASVLLRRWVRSSCMLKAQGELAPHRLRHETWQLLGGQDANN